MPLDPGMVRKARELEMQYMDELKMLENSNRDECMTETSRAPIPTDWVDINKRRLTQTQLQKQAGLSRDAWTIND